MRKTISLNEKHLKLIPFINFVENENEGITINKTELFNVGTGHLLDDIAYILGVVDQAIPNTESDSEGRAYPDALEKEMLELYNYIADNLLFIESLVHFYGCRGGLTVGTYQAHDYDLMWEKV